MYGCMCVLALTKDVDLTISNFLDGRTTYDAAAADDDTAANVINSTNKLKSSTTVRVCLESCLQLCNDRQHGNLGKEDTRKVE